MIEMKNVWKMYDKRRIGLDHQSVTFHDGEITGVLGANGSGKTTMLKAIMGIGELQEGEVLIDGGPVTGQYDRIALITEEGSYPPDLTPNRYADFLEDFFHGFDRKHYANLLRFYGLEADVKMKRFSRGQKAKLEICAGLAKGAKHILMDEPFLGKDLFARRDFLKLMIANLKGDEIILIATHLIDDIENVIDRAVILHKGRIRADLRIDAMREDGLNLADVMAEIAEYQEDDYKRIFK